MLRLSLLKFRSKSAWRETAGGSMAELLTDSEKQAIEAKETPVVEETTVVAEAAPAAGEEPKQDEPEHKKKGGFVRKIERLETANELLERQNRELMERLAARTAETATEPVADGQKPKLENFKTYEDYVEALTDWKIDRDVVAKGYAEQIEKSRKLHPDWDDVFAENGDIMAFNETHQAIREHEMGSEIVYYLLKNPDIAKKLAKMSVFRQVAEVGRISAVLERSETPAPVKPRTTAPAPITPVSGGSTSATPDPSKMSVAEYRKYREAQAS
jgi:hypothetical protein